jgi:hypothetical protein
VLLTGVGVSLQRVFYLGRELHDTYAPPPCLEFSGPICIFIPRDSLVGLGIADGHTVQLLMRRGAVSVSKHRQSAQPVFTSVALHTPDSHEATTITQEQADQCVHPDN